MVVVVVVVVHAYRQLKVPAYPELLPTFAQPASVHQVLQLAASSSMHWKL